MLLLSALAEDAGVLFGWFFNKDSWSCGRVPGRDLEGTRVG